MKISFNKIDTLVGYPKIFGDRYLCEEDAYPDGTIFVLVLISCSQTGRTKLGFEYAKQELDSALHNSSEKIILVDTVIKTQETAVKYAETILFEIYGQKNIEKQKPYEIYKIEEYWIISGTLAKGMRGGTFLIIINSKNGKIIQLTHGK